MKKMSHKAAVLLLTASMVFPQPMTVLAQQQENVAVASEVASEYETTESAKDEEETTEETKSETTVETAAETDKETLKETSKETTAETTAQTSAETTAQTSSETKEEVETSAAEEAVTTLADAATVVGDTVTQDNLTYKVTKLATATAHGTVTVSDGQQATGAIVIPSMVTINDAVYNVTKFGEAAFKDNTNLTAVDFSETTVSEIGINCFSGCTNLTTVLPTQAMVYLNVKKGAFANCTALKKISFNYVQILRACQPFSGSGITEITIMHPVSTLGANAFSGMQEGFTLNCSNSFSAGQIDVYAFGSTKSAVILVADEATQSAVQTKLGTKATVKVFGETASNVFVTDSDGVLTGYADLEKAFEGINASTSEGTFSITLRDSSDDIVWPETMPNKAVTIDFARNSVVLPETITLAAPMTIKNIKNIHNISNTALCTVNAGDNAFSFINNSSFGIKVINGNDITISDVLPGSAYGAGTVINGTGTNPSIAINNVGSTNFYYTMPTISGFSKVQLTDTYLDLEQLDLTGTDALVLNTSSLKINKSATIGSLAGSGTITFASDAVLTVSGTVTGKTKLVTADATMPTAGTVFVKAVNGADDAFYMEGLDGMQLVHQDNGDYSVEKIVMTVTGGTLAGNGYTSFAEAFKAMTADAGTSYNITLLADAALPTTSTAGIFKTCDMPAVDMIIDGNGHKLSGLGTSNHYVNAHGSLTLKNFAADMAKTYLRSYAEGATIEVENSVTGKIQYLEDMTSNTSAGSTLIADGPTSAVQAIHGNGAAGTTHTIVDGFGSSTAAATKYPSLQSTATASKSKNIILKNSWLVTNASTSMWGTVGFEEAGGIAITSVQYATIPNFYGLPDGKSEIIVKSFGSGKFSCLVAKGEITGRTKITVSGTEMPAEGTVLVQAPKGTDDSFYLDGVEGMELVRQDNGDYVVEKIAEPVMTVTGGNLDGKTYASFEKAVKAMTADAGTSYTLTLTKDVTLSKDLTLADCSIVINGEGHTISAADGVTAVNVLNNLDIKNTNLDFDNVTINYTAQTDGKRTLQLESDVTGHVKAITDASESRYLSIKLDKAGLVDKVTGAVSTLDSRLTSLFLKDYGTPENPADPSSFVAAMGGFSLENSYITLAGDCTYLGSIRTPSKATTGGIVLTDDATITGLSLWTDTKFGITMPSTATLNINGSPVGSHIPLKITGTPVDGQVLVHLNVSAYSKQAADLFVLQDAPADTVLKYDATNKEYSIHVHTYTYKSDAEKHWMECSCGEISGEAELHHGGTATCSSKAVCEVCGTAYGELNAENHVWDAGVVTKKATLTADGEKTYTCANDASHTKSESIASPTTFKLAYTSATYNGKAQTPAVTVSDRNGKVIDRKNYTVTYSNNTKAGTATALVTFKGDYEGSKQITFKINKVNNAITVGNFVKNYSTKTQSFYIKASVRDGAKLTYSSDNRNITIDKNGKVTISKKYIGKATITIKSAATGNYNATTKTITVTANPTGTALSGLTDNKDSKVTVKWKKNTVGDGYQLQYSTTADFSKNNKYVTVNKDKTTSATISGLVHGNKYYVRVRTFKKVGKSTFYSGWSSNKNILVNLTPSSTKLSSVKNSSKGKMTVKWGKNSKASGYQIQYSLDGKFASDVLTKTVGSSKTTNTTLSKLAKGKKYYVRIRTYKKVGNKTYYSGWSAVKNITIKK